MVHATTGLERSTLTFGRIANRKPKLSTRTQRGLDLATEMGMVDDNVTDAGSCQALQMPCDQGFPADLE